MAERSEIVDRHKKALDTRVDRAYVAIMGKSKTAADEFRGALDRMTVEGFDQLLNRLSREWVRVYVNRQVLAKEEGIKTPPPAPLTPPKFDSDEPKEQPSTAGKVVLASWDRDPRESSLTMSGLVRQYCDHKDSPYQKVRHTSRTSYNRSLSRIDIDCGPRKLADIKRSDLQALYDGWSAGGKLANGYSLVTQTRMLFAFGADVLNDLDCGRLSVVLRQMSFALPQRKSARLTYAHVNDIIKKAHEEGVHSVALAMALQFGCKFLQADVIGEWVPLTEPGEDNLIDGNQKWIRGLLWSEIDPNRILRRPGLKEIDLKEIPLVADELRRIGTLPQTGPVIVNEETGNPYFAWQYRRLWRAIADAANVPKEVKNIMSGVLKAPNGKTRRTARRPAEDELALTTRH
jgi:hypothetical protein